MNRTYRQIRFNDAMVRAILYGRKTQTRRIIDRVAGIGPVTEFNESDTKGYDWCFRNHRLLWNDLRHDNLIARCPYGKPGDRLWVREAWMKNPAHQVSPDGEMHGAIYRADECHYGPSIHWTPAIRMPRWACRLELEITSVRVERLNDISEGDAVAEGLLCGVNCPDHRIAFGRLWESLNGTGSWAANPWVWALEFKKVMP